MKTQLIKIVFAHSFQNRWLGENGTMYRRQVTLNELKDFMQQHDTPVVIDSGSEDVMDILETRGDLKLADLGSFISPGRGGKIERGAVHFVVRAKGLLPMNGRRAQADRLLSIEAFSTEPIHNHN